MRKIEESLKRFKSRNVNVSSDEPGGSPDTMSDEAKIREQIKYDVGYFCDKVLLDQYLFPDLTGFLF